MRNPFRTRSLRIVPLMVALTLALASRADPVWFSVMGQPSQPDVDSVELNVENIPKRGEVARLDLRVNLAKQRLMTGGEKYQSYISVIEIDCSKDSIVHVHQTRYANAFWKGAGTFQKFEQVRPMAFGGLLPSPKPTILRAACNKTP